MVKKKTAKVTEKGKTEAVPYRVDSIASAALGRRLARGANSTGFGNARLVETLLDGAISSRFSLRLSKGNGGAMPLATRTLLTFNLLDVMGPRPDGAEGPVADFLRELDRDIVGQQGVKEEFKKLVVLMGQLYDDDCRLTPGGRSRTAGQLNRVFLGPTGVGKTTFADMYARLLRECGFLSRGEVIKTTPSDFKGAVNGESEQNTLKILERAKGNVLVIDEAYSLYSDDSFSKAVIDTLVAELPTSGGADMAVVLCGYDFQMKELLDKANPGLARRFPVECRYQFKNCSKDDLRAIVARDAAGRGMQLLFPAAARLSVELSRQAILKNFGNAGAAKVLIENLQTSVARDNKEGQPIAEKDVNDMLMKDADDPSLVGFEPNPALQSYIDSCVARVRLARARNLPTPSFLHLRMCGNPGIGKTVSAKYLAQALYRGGVLATKKVVETEGGRMQATAVGQTAPLVRNLFLQAQGGVLFVDEAHQLKPDGGGADFKMEAVGTLLASMTGDYKDKVLIVLAGYPDKIEDLLSADPGLSRRFPATITLDNLTVDACLLHAKRELGALKIELGDGGFDELATYFEKRCPAPRFGNIGEVKSIIGRVRQIAVQQHENKKSAVEWDCVCDRSAVAAACIEKLDDTAKSTPPPAPAPANDRPKRIVPPTIGSVVNLNAIVGRTIDSSGGGGATIPSSASSIVAFCRGTVFVGQPCSDADCTAHHS